MRVSPARSSFFLVLLVLGTSSVGCGQSDSLETWEAGTFEKQPPERVMDSAGAAEAGFELVRTEAFLPEDLIFVLRVKGD